MSPAPRIRAASQTIFAPSRGSGTERPDMHSHRDGESSAIPARRRLTFSQSRNIRFQISGGRISLLGFTFGRIPADRRIGSTPGTGH